MQLFDMLVAVIVMEAFDTRGWRESLKQQLSPKRSRGPSHPSNRNTAVAGGPVLRLALGSRARLAPRMTLLKVIVEAHRHFTTSDISRSKLTFSLPMRQIFSQYSRIERSEENLPMRALLKMDMRVQRSASW